ncbi:MAG: beta-eliminating lyase-related protein [Pseudomonadota bacterium]
MHFASDNTGPTHPDILNAVIEASEGYAMPYGRDPWAAEAEAQLREVFEAPEASVYLVATGTGGNSLALGTLAAPWSAIFCHERAHVLSDESHGPIFYSGGAAFAPVAGANGKMTPDALSHMLDRYAPGDVHTPARGPLTLTNITEAGTAYTLDEMDALTKLAQAAGVPVHLDGARFANACEALGCSAAELSWKRGIDAVTFGGTKNGCMSVEAILFFDPAHGDTFERQRMRGGHLFSKHRMLSAQMLAYTRDDLWRRLAAQANAAGQYLAQSLGNHVEFAHEPAANMLFVRFARALHRKLRAEGAAFYSYGDAENGPDDEPLLARLVCDWSATAENTDRFVNILRAG